jgi:hypothetical protein
MRPKITSSNSIARSLTYNEQKLTQGKAECLTAANYLKDPDRLTYTEKLHRLQHRMELNDAVKTSQHITLNFDPSDQLSNEKMKEIADSYMKEIGFENQPYLVYRHHDAGHPHCHIVTTHVRSNGDPIEMYNIGKIQSERARLRIEKEYQLMTAEKKQQLRQQQRQPDGVLKITYGESSTTQSISRVLDHVTENYKYTSLKELNTVLRLYNVEAYRGREDSKLYQRRGLLYRVLDQNGRYLGVPLKASFFDSKPTLDNLEKKMTQNQTLKLQHRLHMEASVLWNLSRESGTMEQLRQAMAKDKIRMVLRQDKQGICQDVTYIDLKNKTIYNGSELGERCNHLAIQKIIDREATQKLEQSQNQTQTQKQTYRLRHHF